MREHSHLTSVMEAYTEYKEVTQGIEDSKIIITEETDQEMKEMAREELKELEERLPQMEEKIKMMLIPPDPLEEKNIIMEIRGGTGGDEASLFAAYISFSTIHSFGGAITLSSEGKSNFTKDDFSKSWGSLEGVIGPKIDKNT